MERFFLYLCNFDTAENVNIFGITFWQKFKVSSFPVLKIFKYAIVSYLKSSAHKEQPKDL